MSNDALHKFLARSPVAASFNRAASRYRQHARVQREMATWLAEWLPPNHSGRALEVGAGPGVFTEKLLPWSGMLLATDISPAMCAAGRQALPDASWSVMAAETLEGSGWDWIFCSSMLQWTSRPAKILMGWRERLSPGGRLLAGLFVDETLPEMRAVIGAPGPVRWRSVDAWRADIATAGLRLDRDTVERRVFTYSSALELWRSLHAVGAAPERRVTVGQLRRWLRDYDERYRGASSVKEAGSAKEGVTATWTFYRFEASRV
jgi:malonyl-CoA O-methyltransferase